MSARGDSRIVTVVGSRRRGHHGRERARLCLHHVLEERLGEEEASTMMELLPPVGWADVATKHDVDRAVGELRAEMSVQLAALERRMLLAMLGAVTSATALAFAAARLGA